MILITIVAEDENGNMVKYYWTADAAKKRPQVIKSIIEDLEGKLKELKKP